jgi:VRR-NUC domain
MTRGQPTFWQRRRRPPQPIERHTHIAIADLLRLTAKPGWLWSHIPLGEHRSEKTGALLKRMGTKAGLLDFLLIAPTGQHYWLELKRGNAPLTDAQQAFIEQLDQRGVPWFVARDYESAVNQLKEWDVL